MKVLMFGWEFPPHISGGLGTACYGITKGLSKQGVEVLFVMPSASGDEDAGAAHIINASDVSFESTWTNVSVLFKNVKFLKVSSTLVP
ncbi:MAG: glycogen/starch synthase, partial [Bacteroidales bacterium]|nr:glycogen/starch synthase [Bacteroidales bacterium]